MNKTNVRRILMLLLLFLLLPMRAWPSDTAIGQGGGQPDQTRLFRAGACAIEISPSKFPVLVNGGFLQSSARKLVDPLYARCLVLDDGSMRLAIVVVDSCMMPRELLDRAKELARDQTGIAVDHMLISATHTHSAPAVMGSLGCSADAGYAAILPGKIAESIERATTLLEPARVGWNVIDDPEHTFCRRWIRRPDKMLDDPFGQRNVRANMHPGYENPDAIAPAGPVDPGLTVLSVQSRRGRPIAVLANYSMHYFGAEPVSADYFGRFAASLSKDIGAPGTDDPPLVAIMSQGTSGDQMWMDYGRPENEPGLDAYARAVARFARKAYDQIVYRDWVSLAMAESRLVLGRRVPDAARLAWAQGVVDRMAGREVPNSSAEVYAREAIILHREPRRELKLQAVRIGELGIAAIPNEVFAITGLKIKAQSPFDTTMNIELANGSEGYIPPPEQHTLGGYTTWPARTAGLEVAAEPTIVAAVLGLLEKVADKPQRPVRVADGPYTRSVLASKPWAYWRLDDIQGPTAIDRTGHAHGAQYEGGVAYYLPGANAPGLMTTKPVNRAVHFAGGRLKAALNNLPGARGSIELWFWNGLENDARPITGVLCAFGGGTAPKAPDLEFGVDGRHGAPGRLFIADDRNDTSRFFAGKTVVAPRSWHHLAFVRDRRDAIVYLDGQREIAVADTFEPSTQPAWLSIGGGADDGSRFEGKIDEVALYDRALAVDEIIAHIRAARTPGGSER